MAEEDIGSVVVVDDSRVVGILTFREVIQVLANRHSKWRDDNAAWTEQRSRAGEPAVATRKETSVGDAPVGWYGTRHGR